MNYNTFSRPQRPRYTFHLMLPYTVQQRVLFIVLQRYTSINIIITCQSPVRFKCRCRCRIFSRLAAFSCSSNNSNSSSSNNNSNNDRLSTFCCECSREGVARTSRLCCTGAKVSPVIWYPRLLFVEQNIRSICPPYSLISKDGLETISQDSSVVFSSFLATHNRVSTPLVAKFVVTFRDWIFRRAKDSWNLELRAVISYSADRNEIFCGFQRMDVK